MLVGGDSRENESVCEREKEQGDQRNGEGEGEKETKNPMRSD